MNAAAGLYVHVPFCAALCPYCDFAVVVGKRALHDRYCDALVEEAGAHASLMPAPAASVFVGGGTPTFVAAGTLARALGRIRSLVPVADDAEVTVEANPDSIEEDSLRLLLSAGVNRLSIGAQSMRDHVLRALGRTHDAAMVRDAVAAARAAGFGNLSLDLIYGAQGESDDDWRATLDGALALEPDHVSCYALTIEARTPFGRAVASGRMAEPEQEALAARYEIALDILARAGFEHYELSNWARPGGASRHNVLYWTQGEYLGLGIGAHSHVGGARWWNTRSLRRYLADPGGARDGQETLDDAGRAEEWISLRLRLVEGFDLREAARRLGRDVVPAARALEAAGLASLDGARFSLTVRGMLLENEVALRLLDQPA